MGGVYQFRHIELQRRLANQYRPLSPPTLELATNVSHIGSPTRLHALCRQASVLLGLITLRRGRRHLAAASLVVIFALAVAGSLILAGIISPRSASHTLPEEASKLYSPAIPSISAHSQVRVTQRLSFEPWTQDGVSKQLQVVGTVTGACWTWSSAAVGRPDAFRCFVGHFIVDPCFASSAEVGVDWFYTRFGQVACPYRGVNRVVIIQLTAPLPPTPREQSAHGHIIWLITLANGDQCSLFVGAAAPFLKNMRLNYSCLSGGGLYGSPRQSGRIWMIHYQPPRSANIVLVPIDQMVS